MEPENRRRRQTSENNSQRLLRSKTRPTPQQHPPRNLLSRNQSPALFLRLHQRRRELSRRRQSPQNNHRQIHLHLSGNLHAQTTLHHRPRQQRMARPMPASRNPAALHSGHRLRTRRSARHPSPHPFPGPGVGPPERFQFFRRPPRLPSPWKNSRRLTSPSPGHPAPP